MARILTLTTLAMLAFAGNSLLCRAALDGGLIDAASFTAMRVLSGAVTLWLAISVQQQRPVAKISGHWRSGLALFIYAAAFSFAYLQLNAATGALLLFGAVQLSMMSYGYWHGERFRGLRLVGLLLALAGLALLLLPGAHAPSPSGAILMIGAGMAWAWYSIRGRGSRAALADTAGNFLWALPPSILLFLVFLEPSHWSAAGVALALLSGAITSGLGYVIWYRALPLLSSGTAATVQLSVPVITAMGGVLLLSEVPGPRLVLSGIAVLGGIALVLRRPA